MRIQNIDVSLLHHNTGQIDGLPANPRTWTQDDIDRLAESLLETPELFAARPCLVYPVGKSYVILAGNLRFSASRQNKAKTVPCVVLPSELPTHKLAEIVLKDNGEFGEWNTALLASLWTDLPLERWGVEVQEMEDFSGKNKELNVGDFDENITLRLKYDKVNAVLVQNRLGEDKKATLLNALHYGK